MANAKLEITISDLPEVKEVIKKASDRIQSLESAMQEFVDGYDNGEVGDKYTYLRFKKLLEAN